jgi:carbon storage regulator
MSPKPGLVLTRREGQRIQIGNDVTVELVSIDGGEVRLRVVAPREVRVLREEILSREPKERRAQA